MHEANIRSFTGQHSFRVSGLRRPTKTIFSDVDNWIAKGNQRKSKPRLRDKSEKKSHFRTIMQAAETWNIKVDLIHEWIAIGL
jgi:hypothetical protein